MGVKTRSFLKTENRDFNNILDTVGGPQNVKSVNAATNLSTDDCGTIILGVVGTQQAASTGFTVIEMVPLSELPKLLLTVNLISSVPEKYIGKECVNLTITKFSDLFNKEEIKSELFANSFCSFFISLLVEILSNGI